MESSTDDLLFETESFRSITSFPFENPNFLLQRHSTISQRRSVANRSLRLRVSLSQAKRMRIQRKAVAIKIYHLLVGLCLFILVFDTIERSSKGPKVPNLFAWAWVAMGMLFAAILSILSVNLSSIGGFLLSWIDISRTFVIKKSVHSRSLMVLTFTKNPSLDLVLSVSIHLVTLFQIFVFVLEIFLLVRETLHRRKSARKSKDIIANLQPAEFKLLKTQNLVKDDQTCSICFEEIGEKDEVVHLFECRHILHSHCLRPWLAEKKTCPLCRTRIRFDFDRKRQV